jgi:predicted nucleic acid-binding protein
MKVILDTNVFISGVFFSGVPHVILDAWRHKKITLVLTRGNPRRISVASTFQSPGELPDQ